MKVFIFDFNEVEGVDFEIVDEVVEGLDVFILLMKGKMFNLIFFVVVEIFVNILVNKEVL